MNLQHVCYHYFGHFTEFSCILLPQIHVGELNFSNSCLFLFREFVLKFNQPYYSSFIVIFAQKFQRKKVAKKCYLGKSRTLFY